MKNTNIDRRSFLKAGGGTAVAFGTIGAGVSSAPATAATADAQTIGATTLPYPQKTVGGVRAMPVNQAINFNYPDAESPCVAIKMGSAVKSGVGPNGDIVAFSNLCTHMGCPMAYESATRTFKCNCHYSIFDAEKAGQMVCGQATENLTRVQLQYNAKNDTVVAVGIDGLIYGRQANIL
jgi:arsenite oxidase small subunit